MNRESIRYRPTTNDDVPFLLRLYGSTREEEMKMVDWTAEQKAHFIAHQFFAQKDYYENHYDNCQFLVIETMEGTPLGRIYIDRGPEDIRLVDIALMPEHRGKGLGRILLQEILDEAAAKGQSVSIHVEHYNPAMRLYESLGFRHIDTNGVYHLMEWKPQ